MERLTIVGAGPVGSLLALTLARRGFEVDVFERRPDLRVHDVGGGRSINLALSDRGLHALDAVGVEEDVLRTAVPMRGRLMHAVDGALTFQAYGKDDSEFINSMSRGGLNALLMTAAERAHETGGGRVRIHFQQRLLRYDFARRLAHLRDEATGIDRTFEAPIILGADGSASALRTSIVDAAEGTFRYDLLSHGYKELTLPPAPGDGFGPDGRFGLEPHALHIWPRGAYMVIALANRDGSFTCTLFLADEAPEGQPSLARLLDERSVAAFFAAQFPDLRIPELPRAFLAAPLGRMGTVYAWPWSHGASLLLGDASHGVVPFFGQGMNAGFEDCTVLDALLANERPGRIDWPGLFATFARDRKPDADAIAELALDNYIEMRDLVGDPAFLLRKQVEGELERRLPTKYRSRYGLVTFTRVPYRVALEAGRVQDRMFDELCAGLTRADEVDLARAEQMIDERLAPLLAPHLR